MAGVRELWIWLSRERTRKVLGFLGGGLAVVIGALWQLYVHFAPSPAQPPPRVAAANAAPGVDTAAAARLAASQKRALNDEAGALDSISRQIEAAGSSPAPAAPKR
jgi:hypothetical protein